MPQAAQVLQTEPPSVRSAFFNGLIFWVAKWIAGLVSILVFCVILNRAWPRSDKPNIVKGDESLEEIESDTYAGCRGREASARLEGEERRQHQGLVSFDA
jgi:hypothetical protein